jgi:apolipoprotein N-acyltransferase
MSLFNGRNRLRAFLTHLVVVVAGIILFAASHPNLLFENGLPFLAWVVYVPLVWLLYRVSLGASFFWGALFGFGAYGLFNYWLSVFHPLADDAVGMIYLVYFMFFFPLLKLSVMLFPKRGYILQWLLWISFEYLRTLGFLGYSYGITGYSQWRMIPIIQIADIFGVWGVSALVIFPSLYLAAALNRAQLLPLGGLPDGLNSAVFFKLSFTFKLKNKGKERNVFVFMPFDRADSVISVVWIAALIGTLVYGAASRVDYTDAPTKTVALIQHNTDPWRGDMVEYRRNYEVLRRLSNEAIAKTPNLDLVVWSETAFVPRIYWHITYRDHQESYRLIQELLDYIASQDVPFVIGNDDGRREPDKNPNANENYRVDYNAVMLFANNKGDVSKGVAAGIYRKFHLVPFTESFPYRKQFPMIYDMLRNADTHFWEKGTEFTVMEINGLKFSTPICFEDTFGYLSREFVRNGAELLVNLSNDAWSKSVPAQTQHLSMAVFRAVENRRSFVRATASGQTAAIDPNGKVIAMTKPFVEAQLTATVPIVTATSLYTRYGDFFPHVTLFAAISLLLIRFARAIIKQKRRKGGLYGSASATTEDSHH